MTFKPTMALLMRNLCQGDKQKVQDGNNKKKQKTQQKGPTFYTCMFIVYDVTIFTIKSHGTTVCPLSPDFYFSNMSKELKEKEENMSPTKYNVKNTFVESDSPKSTQERRSFVVEV